MEITNQQNKVAKITLMFWLMKIIATTLGETLGDYLSMTLDLGYLTGLLLTLTFFLLAVWLQISARYFIPSFYWLVIIATTTLGTEISDFIDRSLHLGYVLGSLLLSFSLAIILLSWKKKFGSLSVYPIVNRRIELLYWIAILFSNSLGTAFGDFLSDVIGLGYLQGALLTALVILVVLALHYLTKLNSIVLFWMAFIFTRPFGATFGDFLTKPIQKGGLELPTSVASLTALGLMVVLVIIIHSKLLKQKD